MGWFWAMFWVPAALFVASRVRRRMRYLRGHCGYHARFARRYRDYDDRRDDDDEADWAELRGREFEGWGRSFGRGRRGRLLHGLFRRFDTTPGQEKAIRSLLDRLASSLGDARGEFMAARRELSTALQSEVLDRAALDSAFARNTELFGKLSGELKAALTSLHETLDVEQRKLLAELLARGPWAGRPFRRPAYEL